MRDVPSTPEATRAAPNTWTPRYMSDTPTSSSPAIPIDPILLSTPTPTKDSHSHSHTTAPYFSILSPTAQQQQQQQQQHHHHHHQRQSPPDLHPWSLRQYASSTSTLSPSISASPAHERDELQTPVLRHPPIPPFSPFALLHEHEQQQQQQQALQSQPHSHPTSLSSDSYFSPLDLPPALASPLQSAPMPYHTSPSPQAAYGISGVMMAEPQIMQVSSDPSCNPLLLAQPDVFIAQPAKGRPALRSTLSHNGVYTSTTPLPASATWPRRVVPTTSESHERAQGHNHTASRPSTTESTVAVNVSSNVFAAPPPPPAAPTATGDHERSGRSGLSGVGISRVTASSGGPAHQTQSGTSVANGHTHEANAPSQGFSTSLPSLHTLPSLAAAVPSYAAAPPPPPPTHPLSFSTSSAAHNHTHAQPYTYIDDVPVQATSTSFSPTYENLAPSYSPWPAHSSLPASGEILSGPPGPGGRPLYYISTTPPSQHFYMSGGMSAKLEEPILAPGELPVPRPPMSYAALIGEALLLAPPPHQLYVSEISDSVKRRYPYYRQNPSKIYNGVRHQTSMCKAFVKMPRPWPDHSGGARKWAIRAGCESWFHSGGYHPPGGPNGSSASSSTSPTQSPAMLKTSRSHSTSAVAVMGKAKATARSKQLAIGVPEPETIKARNAKGTDYEPYSPSSGQGGPSLGPAYDGSSRPAWVAAPSISSLSHPAAAHFGYHAPTPLSVSGSSGSIQGSGGPAPGQASAPAPGWQYLPIPHHAQHQHSYGSPHPHPHPHPGHPQPMYVPVFPHQHPHQHPHAQSPGQHFMPTPMSQAGPVHGSPEWRYEAHTHVPRASELRGEGGQAQGQGQGEMQGHPSPDSAGSLHSPNGSQTDM